MAQGVRAAGLTAEALSFCYGHRTIFEDVNFAIPAGEIWGLIGRSGIGKSTLLNIALGLYQPTSGTFRVGDARVAAAGAIRGAVFRDGSLLPWLSLLDNVIFPRRHGQDEEEASRAQALLAEAGLGGRFNALPKELSAGMAKRVEIVRALVLDDDYFVADEPFVGLDVLTRLDLHRMWLRLKQANQRTGILCTHDPAEAIALCDAVLVMRDRGDGVAMVDVARFPHAGELSGLLGLADARVKHLVEMMG